MQANNTAFRITQATTLLDITHWCSGSLISAAFVEMKSILDIFPIGLNKQITMHEMQTLLCSNNKSMCANKLEVSGY